MADQGVVDEAQKSSLAESFCAITASTTETALFFLESHTWNLDSAIHSFFEADEDDHHDALAEEAPSPPPAAAIPRPNIPPPSAAPRPNIPPSSAAPVPNARKSKKASSSSGGGGRPVIRTLADLNRQSGAGSDSDDSDGPAEYYTGGEKSGMLVQDPSKGGNDVDAIFDQVRQMGAMDGPLEHHPSSSSRSFTGTGRLLSGETVAPTPPQRPENVIHNICFWTNGFTVNDGPLRRFDDPENAPFLESIRKSECPKELEPADRRTEVDVNLIRKADNFPEPPKRSAAFQGVGRTLGGGSASGSAVVQPTVAAAAAAAPDLSIGLSVDASLPSTSLQLRLADGTRMVARFNMSHTVGHIRAFIDASRPGASRTYQLQTVGFPPKQLADSTQTIEQAGLANSVVVQKL